MTEPALLGRIQLFALTYHSPVRWRLLSGNNREVARSVAEYRDRESCLLAIKQARETVTMFVPVVRRNEQGRWTWELQVDGDPVVHSPQGFVRQIRCEQGLGHFLATVSVAEISAATLVSHARRWEQRTLHSPPPPVRRERLR
ncbi:MAG TPA: hypothetical protein VJ831_15955 [Jatrophihabitantaceae bacterium]|nr:hypothetical protein [Jatrophihabitantaceae bacterium]